MPARWFSAKPLPKPILTYRQWHPWEWISLKLRTKLEQLECLHSEIPPATPWLPILVKLRLHGTRQAARQPRRKNRNIGMLQERLHGDTQQTRDCCEPGWQFKFELIIAARHMLSRAVASVFFEEHRPQKLPIHGLYAGVARDSCLPCKCFCRAASRAATCRGPVALLVAPRVNVPWFTSDPKSKEDKVKF